MTEQAYENLDVLITRDGEGYAARIVNSPDAGEASMALTVPFSHLEIGELMMMFRNPRHSAAEMKKAKDFGGKLFGALFDNRHMWNVLSRSMDTVDAAGKGLRIRLRMDDVPELAALPWEYLYDPEGDRFFVLSPESPLVRYVELPERLTPLTIEPPLNVLVMISGPSDQVPLDTDAEWEWINKALEPLIAEGQVTVDRLEDATIDALQTALNAKPYHVFHYIGHGEFDKPTDMGVLLFEKEDGTTHRVAADMLARLLASRDSVRVAVVNACEGALGSDENAFGGTAQKLVQQGLPAAVAMQFKISDVAAVKFANRLYLTISQGYPIDTALTEARFSIYTMEKNIEWGTPVLYLRAPDGRIFTTDEEGAVSEENKKDGKGDVNQQGNVNQNVQLDGTSIGGDFTLAGGDVTTVGGDYVGGDKTSIQTGDIKGDTVTVGVGNTVTKNVNTGVPTPFDDARTALAEADLAGFKEKEATTALENLEEVKDEEEVDQDMVDYYLEKLEEFAPSVVEILINAVTSPGAAVGKGLQTALKAYRQHRNQKK